MPKRPPLTRAAVILAVVLVALVAGSIPLVRIITSPLERLTEAVQRFGAGELSARVGMAKGGEVGNLARSFDEMAARIEALVRGEKELLANLSHELRTPLARIRVALDLAAEGDAARAAASLGEIGVDLAELERLVEDILTAARLDLAKGRAGESGTPLRLQEVAAGEVLERAAEKFQAAHPDRRLEVQSPGALPVLTADPALLRRALDNLLDNARKYSDVSKPIALAASAAGDQLVFEVKDEGIGIEREDLERLFTPFFRTDSRARAAPEASASGCCSRAGSSRPTAAPSPRRAPSARAPPCGSASRYAPARERRRFGLALVRGRELLEDAAHAHHPSGELRLAPERSDAEPQARRLVARRGRRELVPRQPPGLCARDERVDGEGDQAHQPEPAGEGDEPRVGRPVRQSDGYQHEGVGHAQSVGRPTEDAHPEEPVHARIRTSRPGSAGDYGRHGGEEGRGRDADRQGFVGAVERLRAEREPEDEHAAGDAQGARAGSPACAHGPRGVGGSGLRVGRGRGRVRGRSRRGRRVRRRSRRGRGAGSVDADAIALAVGVLGALRPGRRAQREQPGECHESRELVLRHGLVLLL
jgi:HAMP domain-containing protein